MSTQREQEIITLARIKEGEKTWFTKDEGWWLKRLGEEFGQLAAAMVRDKSTKTETQLQRIGSITINWLNYRDRKKERDEKKAK